MCHVTLKIGALAALLVLGAGSLASAQNLNPFDKDSDVRKFLRETDPSRILANEPTQFHGSSKIVRRWTTITNLGNGRYHGYFLDIDGHNGDLMLNEHSGK